MKSYVTEDLTRICPIVTLKLIDKNGAETHVLGDSDIVSESMSFKMSVGNQGEITIGAAIITELEFSLFRGVRKFKDYDWTNSSAAVWLSVKGHTIFMGQYFVIDHTENGVHLTVRAHDPLAVLDKHQLYEAGITWPCDAVDAIKKLFACGLSSGIQFYGLDECRGVTVEDPWNDQMYNRDALAWLCQCIGKWCIYSPTQSGGAAFRFGSYVQYGQAHEAGMAYGHDLSSTVRRIASVEVIPTDGDTAKSGENFDEEDPKWNLKLTISGNPFITDKNKQVVANRIWNANGGGQFFSGTVSIMSDPRIEAGDMLSVQMLEEYVDVTRPVMATDITYRVACVQESVRAYAPDDGSDLRVRQADYVTKQDLEHALDDPDSDLRKKLDDLYKDEGGGGGTEWEWPWVDPDDDTPDDVPTVAEYYEMLRGDWIKMPQPSKNEIYLLWKADPGTEERLCFSRMNAQYNGIVKIEAGTVDGAGNYAPKETLFEYVKENASDPPYASSVYITAHAYDWSSVAEDGEAQVMLRLTTKNPYSYNAELMIGDVVEPGQSGGSGTEGWIGTTTNIVEIASALTNVTLKEYTTSTFGRLWFIAMYEGTLYSGVAKSSLRVYRLGAWCAMSRFPELVAVRFSVSASGNSSYLAYNDKLDVVEIDFSLTTNCQSMLSGCAQLRKVTCLNGDGVDLPKATTVASMFSDCSNLKFVGDVTLGEKCTTAGGMFSGCKRLRRVPSIEMPGVYTATSMFDGCTNLIEVGGIEWNDTGYSFSANNMFRMCSNLLRYDSGFPKCSQLNASYMFSHSGLRHVGNIEIDTNGNHYVDYMFQGCDMLTSVDSVVIDNGARMNYMFSGCYHLRKVGKLYYSKEITSPFGQNYELEEIGEIGFKGNANVSNTPFGLTDAYNLRKLKVADTSAPFSISIGGYMMMHDGLMDLIDSLPENTGTSQYRLTISYERLKNSLTAEDIELLNSKGYVLY